MASLVVSGSAITSTPTSGIVSPRNLYTSLERVRKYLSLASQQTTDDNQLKEFIRNSSRTIDRFTHRRFYPQRDTKFYDLPEDTKLFKIKNDDLLEVQGLSAHNGASEVDSGVYWPKAGGDYNKTPYDRIELDNSIGSLLNFTGTPQRAVHLDGVFGFHENYDDAWVDSNASLTGSITSTQTIASISGSAGRNSIGYSPRVWTEQIWRVDSEYMHVVTSESTSRVRVIRGVNGTTAASHASGTTVETWEPEEDIEYCARELAAFEYLRSTTPLTNRITTFGGGGVSVEQPFSEGLPPSVRFRLERFVRRRIYNL